MYVMKTDLEACERVAAALKHFYPFYAFYSSPTHLQKRFLQSWNKFLYKNQWGQKSSSELSPILSGVGWLHLCQRPQGDTVKP